MRGLHAAGQPITGEGRFYSQEGDALSFINQQLLNSAVKDIVSKELAGMGLDAKLFWEKYNLKFDEYMSDIETELKQEFGMADETKKISAKKRELYQKTLRKRRLNIRTKFGRLNRILTQYSQVKRTRSTKDPNSRFLRIKAKIDRNRLHKIYLRFTAENPNRNFSGFYLSTNLEIKGGTWPDVGVEIEKDFHQVVSSHWKKKLSGLLEDRVDQVVLADTALNSKLNAYMKTSIEALESMNVKSEEGRSDGVSDSIFSESLWLKIHFTIKKIDQNDETKKRSFEIEGDLVCIDLANKKVIQFADYSPLKMKLSFEDEKVLSSTLANSIFQLPLEKMTQISNLMNRLSKPKDSVTLKINSASSMKDILDVIKLLKQKGLTKRLSTQLLSLQMDSASVKLEFRQDLEGLKTFIRSLEGVELNKNSILHIPNAENPFELQVVKQEIVEEEEKKTPETI
jgi:hypothetical protein